MRLLVVNNKSSGHGGSLIYDFIRIAGEAGDEIVLRNISPNADVPRLVRDARDFDMVVAAGGDGTVASVCYELRGSGIPIMPFPAGTGNLLSMNLSSPEEPRALAGLVRSGNVERYDLGELSYTDDGGIERTNGFAIMAGAGYDAIIMNGATALKRMFGQNAYYLSAIITDRPTKAKIMLSIDGQKVSTSGIGVLLVNFAKIAPDIAVTHVNDARDGLLEVVILKPDKRRQLLPALIAAHLDRRGQFPTRTDALEIYAGSEIEISTNPPLPIQFDGEVPAAHTPIRARCLPGALTAVVDDMEVERLRALRELDEA